MRKITFGLLFIIGAVFHVSAQYTTPDTGVDWTLDDIVAASPATITVSGNTYTLLEDIIVAESDILKIDSNLILEIEAGVRVTVFGSFFINAAAVTITAVDEMAPYNGFRFEEFSDIHIQNTTIEYGGGLQVLTESFTLDNSILRHNVTGTATGGTVTLSRGMPVITNNTFLLNANPAISSAANTQVSAYIFNNHIEANNQSNANRPQINMGGTRATDTLKIIQNTIIGDRNMQQAGGIAVANLVGGTLRTIIENNTIRDNRYGITIVGPNSYARITNNIIEFNDTQGDPLAGGSGINLNSPPGDMTVDIDHNEIRSNLWGITLQGVVNANLGDDLDNPGMNVFSENGNNGDTFAIYNNTPGTISAKNNCWVENGVGTLAEAEAVIFHVNDDPTLGEVIFDPINCSALSTSDIVMEDFMFYPNPAKDVIGFINSGTFETLEIFDLQGKKVYESKVSNGRNTITFDLNQGMYFVNFKGAQSSIVKKLLVK